MGKEKIPLELLDLLKVEKNPDLSLLTYRATDSYFLLIPKELDSVECYFSVIKKSPTQINGTPTKYDITFKPAARNNPDSFNGSRDIAQIKISLETWISFIKELLNSDTIFDDPILTAYKKEFEEKITILDSDSQYAPFDLEKQIAIVHYLDWVQETIQAYKEDISNDSFKDIQKEVKDLKDQVTVLTKQKIIKKLAIIWSKCRKESLPLIKEIFIEVVSNTISKMING